MTGLQAPMLLRLALAAALILAAAPLHAQLGGLKKKVADKADAAAKMMMRHGPHMGDHGKGGHKKPPMEDGDAPAPDQDGNGGN